VCKDQAPRDCSWSSWGEWSSCTVSCGDGWQFRTHQPSPATNGGQPCQGVFQQFRECGRASCPAGQPCKFDPWSDWSPCSWTCNGHMERVRTVHPSDPNVLQGAPCEGSLREVSACNVHADGCAVGHDTDCQLSTWSEWGPCSRPCGGGQQFSTRQVAVQPRGRGKTCGANGGGTLKRTKSCNTDWCSGTEPVDCALAPWSLWSDCTASCDGGEQQRQRSIVTEPKNGGRPCNLAEMAELRACNEHGCDVRVSCEWSEWHAWQACSQTCGGGERSRTRELAPQSTAASTSNLDELSGLLTHFLSGVDGGESANRFLLTIGAALGSAGALLLFFARNVRRHPARAELGRAREAADHFRAVPVGDDAPLEHGE